MLFCQSKFMNCPTFKTKKSSNDMVAARKNKFACIQYLLPVQIVLFCGKLRSFMSNLPNSYHAVFHFKILHFKLTYSTYRPEIGHVSRPTHTLVCGFYYTHDYHLVLIISGFSCKSSVQHSTSDTHMSLGEKTTWQTTSQQRLSSVHIKFTLWTCIENDETLLTYRVDDEVTFIHFFPGSVILHIIAYLATARASSQRDWSALQPLTLA